MEALKLSTSNVNQRCCTQAVDWVVWVYCFVPQLFTFPVGHFLIIDEFLVVIPDGLDRFAEPLEVDARFVNL